MKRSSFAYSQAAITIAVNAANALNIAFMLMVLRLPARDFAEITSILAITFLFSVSQSSARNELLLVQKETGDVEASILRTKRSLVRIAIAGGLAVCAGSGVIAKFLHFSSPASFVIAAGCSITYIANGIMQGIFAAKNQVNRHAVALTTESMARIPLAVLFLADGYQSEDAAWIMLLASAISMGINVAILSSGDRRALLPSGKRGAGTRDGRTTMVLLASTLLIGVAQKVDILWAKHVLSAEQAGTYGMMSFVASVLFLNSSGVVRSSLSYLTKSNVRAMMRFSYGIILCICAFCIAGFFVVGLPLLQWLSKDAEMIDLTAQSMLFGAAIAYSIINFNFQVLSVLHRNVHLTLSAALVMALSLGLWFVGHDMRGIALSQLVVMIGMIAAYLPPLLRFRKKPVLHAFFHAHGTL